MRRHVRDYGLAALLTINLFGCSAPKLWKEHPEPFSERMRVYQTVQPAPYEPVTSPNLLAHPIEEEKDYKKQEY